jgi:hypothetical protein
MPPTYAAFFIRLIIGGLIFLGLTMALPAFIGILGFSLDGNWRTLLQVACAAVAISYVFFGRPQSIGG